MMKRFLLTICILLFTFLLFSCDLFQNNCGCANKIDATDHGLSTENSGEENSAALQELIDELSLEGGTVYIPEGEYLFAENGSQTIGSHCIKMRSNVSIVGDGDGTVLRPVGESNYGLDMFYFNDYLDTGEANYLENCTFSDFLIDARDTSCRVYTSAGKGFMFNLFKNCHWQRVTVKNTDATGFGVDCPINGSITDCTAIGCGKAASEENGGASGFGIGFGYCAEESITISGCRSLDNKKFGFFLEHQGRFSDERYSSENSGIFNVADCTASGNLYNFGGICAMNTVYEECSSDGARKFGFYFENSTDSAVKNCKSENEGEAGFAIIQNKTDGELAASGIVFLGSSVEGSPVGAKIVGLGAPSLMGDNKIIECDFGDCETAVYTEGEMHSLTLKGNLSSSDKLLLLASIREVIDTENSWN